MMVHPRFEHLRAFADGRLATRQKRRTAAHLAACDRCRESVAWIREVRQTARDAVDVRVPVGAWERIAARVQAGETVLLPVEGDTPAAPRPGFRGAAVRAAVLVLALAGAASAALPGSPVRTWLGEILSTPEAVESPAPTPGAASPSGESMDVAPEVALLVAPAEGTVAIVIEGPDPSLRIRVRSVEAGEVGVRARGEATSARFRSGPGRLTIVEAGAGEITLELPHSTRVVTLEVDGRRYLTKEGGRLRLSTPVADTIGSEFVLPILP